MKFNVTDSEQQLVGGLITSQIVDRDRQVLDYDSSKRYFQAWSESVHSATSKVAGEENASFGNVRLMHGKQTVGKLVKVTFDDTRKAIFGVAKVTDVKVWSDIKSGVYSAFSVGAKLVSKVVKNGVEYLTINPMELSIVDYPANSDCTFQFAKSSGCDVVKVAGNGVDLGDFKEDPQATYAAAEHSVINQPRRVAQLCGVPIPSDTSDKDLFPAGGWGMVRPSRGDRP